MSDDLETRLSRLSELSTGEAPPVEELHRRRRRQSLRRAQLGTAALVVLVAVGGIVGLNARRTSPTEVSTAGPPTARPEPTTPGPDDGEPINGPGGTVGWVEREIWDEAALSGPPQLDIGTGAVDIVGFEVRDGDGDLVGYFLPGPIGYLALERTADPEAVDELVLANAPMSQAEAQQLFEDMRDEAEGDGGP